MQKKRTVRHFYLAGISSLMTAVIYLLIDSPDSLFLLSMSTAYTGVILIAVTLTIGPLNLMSKKINPVSTYLRRDIGIWAAIVSIIHVVFGLQRHMDGRMMVYFFHDGGYTIRFDTFGLANHSGLLATLVCLALLMLSNNASLRKLGTSKWKNIQRLNYLSFLMIIGHGFIYQLIEKRQLPFVIIVALITIIVFGFQWKGFKLHKKTNS